MFLVMMGRSMSFICGLILLCAVCIQCADIPWVVIVSTSRFWFNYRHTANGIAFYNVVRSFGVPDSQIIFMNSLCISDEDRNPNPSSVSFQAVSHLAADEWSMEGVEFDYVDEEVSVESFLMLLTGRSSPLFNGRNKLNSNRNSSVLIYMAGHGGDEFFKFHDREELSAQDLGAAFHEMHTKGRYKEVLLVLDTCKAATMANYITAPAVTTLASSAAGENSYAYPTDPSLGVAIIDRFTHSMFMFFESYSTKLASFRARKAAPVSQSSPPLSPNLQQLHRSFQPSVLHSTATILQSQGSRHVRDMLLSDFFGPNLGSSDALSSSVLPAGLGKKGGNNGAPSTSRSSGARSGSLAFEPLRTPAVDTQTEGGEEQEEEMIATVMEKLQTAEKSLH
jgi:GPI-anchor transamidase subunit K